MSDRLKDLQRQRALAQEQLAWLDREIAKETGQAPATAQPFAGPATPKPFAAPPAAAPDTHAATRAAEEIIAQYKDARAATDKDVKRGCYLYFAFAFAALVILVAGAYILFNYLRK